MEDTQYKTESAEVSIFDELQPKPVYYSEKAVYIFTLLFGVLFGGVLMAINLKNSPAKKGIWQVLGFAIVFTAVQAIVPSYVPQSSSMTLVFNILGGAVIRYFFWAKYIGKDAVYSKRSIVVPLIIGVLFIACIVVVLLLGI